MPDDFAGHIIDVNLADALSERYLAYAMSTIMSRSLPDVRDGLKPVHRRILYGMAQLRLDPTAGFKKCARVVGDVMGKYHPHGDSSIYEAMVRLAQDFAVRYPLVEGQGNFGNIDGDNAAAMRYTEARLTEMSSLLLEGISEDAVDFRPTYDGVETEPTLLPAAFPNILANGAAGIAVGMATSIPPHNLGESCAAALHLIANPHASVADLLVHMPGPDFPTGGTIVEDKASILQAYETGRGGFRVRARWEVEHGKGGAWEIIITEIPYQVQKARLIEQLAELMDQKKLPLLDDVRDESTEVIRLMLVPKSKTTDPAVLMETLFRATPLESRFPLNMNVLTADQTPRVLSLKEVLQAWLDHRQIVLQRRSRHRLVAIERRMEIVAGFLTVYANLDEVIRIIRQEDKPGEVLARTFSLSELQVEAVLNMRLRALAKLEEITLRKEHASLGKEGDKLRALLASEKLQWRRISADLDQVRSTYSDGPLGSRRSVLGQPPAQVDLADLEAVEREAITVILSAKGWIRAVKGAVAEPGDLKFKTDDSLRILMACDTTDRICLFTRLGRSFSIKAGDIPRGRGDGQPVRVMAELAQGDEFEFIFVWKAGLRYLLASDAGYGFIIKSEDLLAERKGGKQVLTLKEGQKTLCCLQLPEGANHVAAIDDKRKLIVFPLEQVLEMPRGQGVVLQKCKETRMRDIRLFAWAEGLSWKLGEKTRTEKPAELKGWLVNRGGVGRLPPSGFPKSGRFE